MSAVRLLLVPFLVVPIAEIWVLIEVGSVVGPAATIGLVVLTAVVGVALMRAQGLATLFRARSAMGRGEVPALELLEGAVILIAAALLLTPGFVTDAAGFACLIPSLRRCLILAAVNRRQTGPTRPRDPRPRRDHPEHGRRTLEGEFWRPEDPDRHDGPRA